MQVERKPSRWPYVGMLVGLLLACLVAPSYWQTADETEQTLGGRERTSPARNTQSSPTGVQRGASTASLIAKEVPFFFSGAPSLDWIAATGLVPDAKNWPEAANRTTLMVGRTTSIEELIASFDALPTTEVLTRNNNTVYTIWPATPAGSPGRTVAVDNDAVAETPGPYVTAGLRWLGGTVVEYSPTFVGRWLGESVSHYWQQLANDTLGIEAEGTPDEPAFPTGDPVETPVAEPFMHGDFEMPVAAGPSRPKTVNPWTVPDALFGQLSRLGQDPYSAYWANQAISHLQALLQVDRFEGDETAAILAALDRSTATAKKLADRTVDDRMRVELLRAHWALARRLDCWKLMNDIRVAAVADARFATLGSLDSLLHDVAERNDLESLGTLLEEYEQTRDPALANRVALATQTLAASPAPLDRALADAVEQHYRNANVRVAITDTMLNRFVPDEQNESQQVWDRIAGTPVRGESQTSAKSRIRLVPATGRWQMKLESTGVVDSNTLANGGHAKLRSYGTTDFTVRKSVIVEPNGVQMQPSIAQANNHNQLAGVTTDFDWVPLFGAFARSRAVDQYQAKRSRAKAEIECKVTDRVGNRLDQEAVEAVDRVERQVRDRVTGPLAEGGVEITPVEMTTTSERLIARLRVAGAAQLGGHTPRPRALSDSLVSVQVHETAVTNAAASLGLNGQRLSAPQLQAKLQEKFPGLRSDSPPEAREDTVFQFADQGAVQFHIDGGRFEIAVKVDEFVQEGRHIRNFIVHAYYLPVVQGMSAELVRDGALGIEGRISANERARLYSVFNEVLGAERRLPVLKFDNPSDSRLDGLMITQLVLEDGWLGLAVGPDGAGRVAERERSIR